MTTKDIVTTKLRIPAGKRHISALLLSPAGGAHNATGILWLHGGGYALGTKSQVCYSRAIHLVTHFGCVVLAPDYRLSWQAPFPAAVEDCYTALLYLKNHTEPWYIRPDQLVVMGCSAGGGLTAALSIMARDRHEVAIAFQLPLYPMLDNLPTPSSRDNHARLSNTRNLRIAWWLYLRDKARQEVSVYATPARQTDYSNLPPAYTFIGDGEAFYCETKAYIDHLRAAGVPAQMDVWHTDKHAFDQFEPDDELSRQAISRFNDFFAYAQQHFFAPQFG